MIHLFRSAAAIALTLIAPALAAATESTPPSSAASALASPLPSATSTVTNPPENPLVTTRVQHEFTAWQRGRIERGEYSPAAGGTYDDALVKVIQPDLAIGPLQTVMYRTTSLLFGDLVYRYDIAGTFGVVSVLYSLDQRGRTDGIVFTPKIFTGTPTTP